MTTATATATTTATFEVGASYEARSACDHNCVWSFEVVKRTAKFVTLVESNGETMRVGVHEFNDAEWALPFGSFSMAPTISADRPVSK